MARGVTKTISRGPRRRADLSLISTQVAPEDDDRDYSPERVARERRKLADAQAASSSLQNPLSSRRRRRGRAPSTAEELSDVLRARPERPCD